MNLALELESLSTDGNTVYLTYDPGQTEYSWHLETTLFGQTHSVWAASPEACVVGMREKLGLKTTQEIAYPENQIPAPYLAGEKVRLLEDITTRLDRHILLLAAKNTVCTVLDFLPEFHPFPLKLWNPTSQSEFFTSTEHVESIKETLQ